MHKSALDIIWHLHRGITVQHRTYDQQVVASIAAQVPSYQVITTWTGVCLRTGEPPKPTCSQR